MAVSPITGITLEDQPLELSSFLRSGVTYVFWATPVVGRSRRIRWKPHSSGDFTEVIPTHLDLYNNVSSIYDPTSGHLVVVWDDGDALDNSRNGTLYVARFDPLTAALISGPTVLFQGAAARLSYLTTTQNSKLLIYYKTAKNMGVYGRRSEDGGLTWGNAYPLITGQVSATSALEVVPYDGVHASIAQLGSSTRTLTEVSMLQRTRPITSILRVPNTGQVGHPLDPDTVALWRFDETGTTWADATGRYPLTQTGSPASITGRVGKARRFSTSGQYALGASNQAARDAITDGEFTVEFWYFVSTAEFVGAPATGVLFSLQGDQVSGEAQNALYQVQVASPSRALNVYSQSGINVGQFGPAGVVAPLDAWTHFAWRSQSDGLGTFNWDVFMNGVFSARRTLRVAPGGGSAAQFQIGSGLNAGVAPHATLDDIRISNVPRTDAEILASATGQPFDLYVAEPSKFDNTTLTDNLRGSLVVATTGATLYNLDGAQQGTSDTFGAVSRLSVAGTTVGVVESIGPSGNGDDLVSYSRAPVLDVATDLPGTSYAVSLAVTPTHGYIAEYADNSGTAGQLVVINLSSRANATVFTGVTAVRAVGVANFLTPKLIFAASTESGVERLRVYEENALTPSLLLNTKLTSRVNSITVAGDPTNATGALLYVSCIDRLSIYRYASSSLPVQLVDSLTLAGGSNFFQTVVAANGNVVAATGNAGVMVLSPDGRVLAQLAVSGKPVLDWKPSKAYALNDLVKPRAIHQFARSRYYFKATTAGTSGSSEPSWAATGTIVDSGAQWTAVGLTDGIATGVALDETNHRIYAVGVVGGVLGTDGRVWVINAPGLV